MKQYKVFSAKDQGCYKKGELLYSLTEQAYQREFGNLPFEKVSYDGHNFIFIQTASDRREEEKATA